MTGSLMRLPRGRHWRCDRQQWKDAIQDGGNFRFDLLRDEAVQVAHGGEERRTLFGVAGIPHLDQSPAFRLQTTPALLDTR